MLDMHLKYDNMHNNLMIYDLKCSNNHIIYDISYMILKIPHSVLCIVHGIA